MKRVLFLAVALACGLGSMTWSVASPASSYQADPMWPAGGPVTPVIQPLLGAPPQVFAACGPTGWPGAAGGAAALLPEADTLAILDPTRQEVQWSPAGASEWQPVVDPRPVRPGDRVRTGPGAAARIV